MRIIASLIVLTCSVSLIAAPQYPFPQNVSYTYGIVPSSIKSDRVQAAYKDFIDRFYEESPDKSMARIRWDNAAQTVSEGIGYGMLIMVYMDNATNNTKDKFDKLWKYYNSFLNGNGLMNWKIDGFNNVSGMNAATDAEVDVAVALLQANKQWGDQKYLDDARALIDKIWNHEVNGNGYLKPGDSWDTKKNPSYFSTAALESFKQAGSQDWGKVIGNSYSLIKKVQHQTTGLIPDWCQEDGSTGDGYHYDAARTPWRMAWGYLWYGHDDAKEICSKLADWLMTSTGGNAASVVDGYNLDGSKTSEWLTSTFLGAFACAGMVDARHQTWLDNAYRVQDSLIDVQESYFNTSLKVIYLLLLSGNMPDFWNPPTPQKFTVTVETEPSQAGVISFSPAGPEYSRGDTVTVTAMSNDRYTFARWSGDVNGTDSILKFAVTGDMIVRAMFNEVGVTAPQIAKGLPVEIANPFHGGSGIRFSVSRAGLVSLHIHSLEGKLIARPVEGYYSRGSHICSLMKPLSGGVYLFTLRTPAGTLSRTLTVNR
ncbi:MAG: hypothetical protein JW863_01750 [Chitinispirillaceae bacterium]|nr:hypothetical protein [Chitinispirillaceae bacterium]